MPKLIEVPIDKNIPIPEFQTIVRTPGNPRNYKLPWEKMEVGDSFFCKRMISTTSNKGVRKGYIYLRRKVEGGHRVWRVK